MLIGYYTDPHWTMHSPMLPPTPGRLAPRLEMMIESYRWMYNYWGRNVDVIVNGGDLTDRPDLHADEISALSSALSLSRGLPEYHVLGNHEKMSEDSKSHSLSLLNLSSNIHVIETPQRMDINPDVSFLPYSHQPDLEVIKSLSSKVLFSHITIMGSILTSNFKTDHGVDPVFLEKYFNLIANGHIHTSSWVGKRSLNLGTLAGLSFSDTYKAHYPSIAIIDTDKGEVVEIIENPHALRFLKIETDTVAELSRKINGLKEGKYVIRAKVPFEVRDNARQLLDSSGKVIASRVSSKIEEHTVLQEVKIDKVRNYESGQEALIEFVKNKDKLPYELNEVLDVIRSLEG